MPESNPEKRVRLGCMVKPDNLAAVKRIKADTGARSEGVVIDAAIERLNKSHNRNRGK